MDTKRTYYGYTTAQQRKLLFEIWEATGSVTGACQKARVSRGTFYHWKSRFEKSGYAGLEKCASHAPHKRNAKAPSIAKKVVELRCAHLDWGKARFSLELSKANNWVPIVSPNTVRRILQDAGLWPESGTGGKKTL
jgi:transposase